jgi:hypothetical protein
MPFPKISNSQALKFPSSQIPKARFARYQIFTLSAGARYILSPGFTLNAV